MAELTYEKEKFSDGLELNRFLFALRLELPPGVYDDVEVRIRAIAARDEELRQMMWSYGSGPGTLAGDDDL